MQTGIQAIKWQAKRNVRNYVKSKAGIDFPGVKNILVR
jgi:hypothetical protein